MILGTFGTPASDVDAPELQMKAGVRAIATSHPKDLRILYGRVWGQYGLYVLPEAAWYGPIIPDLAGRLECLLALSCGEIREMN